MIETFKKRDLLVLFLIILIFTLIYSFIAWQKHQHFQTFAWDTAIFDQQLYLISQLKVPFSSLHGFIGLGDHFHPLLYLVGGIAYKFWTSPGVLFILQSTIACLSALPLYLSAKYILSKTPLKEINTIFISLLLVLMYLLSVSFQFMVVGEYNDAPTVTLPLLFLLYFLIRKNEKGFWISYVFMLLTKEEYSLLSIPIALYLFLKWKNLWNSALVILIGLSYFFILTMYLMPKISGTNEYIFFSKSNRPQDITQKMISNPTMFLTKFVDNEEKQKTIIVSLTSFGFIPVFSLQELLIPISTLAIRFYDETVPRRFEFNNQYAAGLISPLAFATIFGLKNIIQFLTRKKYSINQITYIIFFYLISVTIYQNITFHGPINSLFKKQFYEVSNWELNAHELVKAVPKNAVVASQNSLLPHLSERSEFYLLPKHGNAEYIAVDFVDGPNKFAPSDINQIKDLIQDLVDSQEYKIVWQKGDCLLLRRNNFIDIDSSMGSFILLED